MNDFVTFVLHQITVNTPHVKVFELEVFCELFAVLFFGHEHKYGTHGGKLNQVTEKPLPLESSKADHFYGLGDVFGCFANVTLLNKTNLSWSVIRRQQQI